MPPQIRQLLLLFAIFISLFIGVRYLLVPESFGNIGHYRALSLYENELREIKFAGDESCIECHDDVIEMFETDVHSELSCEGCHGPCQDHVNLPDSTEVNKSVDRKFCALCHSINAARSTDMIFQIDLQEHEIDKNCIDCHNPHMPWELKEEE